MGELVKFNFDNVFDEDQAPVRAGEPEQDPRELPVYSEIDLDAARAEAFEQGTVVGGQRARDTAQEAIVAVLDRIGRALPDLVAQFGEIREDARKEAAVLAFKIASKLAGELIGRQPLAEVEAMIADALAQLGEQGNVPRIVVRVAEDLVDGLGEHVDGLAARAGFSGQIVLLADRDMGGSNCRVEWADGGAERDVAALEHEIEAAVMRYVRSHENGVPERETADAVSPDAELAEAAPAPVNETAVEAADEQDAAIEDGGERAAEAAEEGPLTDIENVGAEEAE